MRRRARHRVIGPDHFRNFFYDVMPAFSSARRSARSATTARPVTNFRQRGACPVTAYLLRHRIRSRLSLHMGRPRHHAAGALFAPRLVCRCCPSWSRAPPREPSLRRARSSASIGRAVSRATTSEAHVDRAGFRLAPPTDPIIMTRPELRQSSSMTPVWRATASRETRISNGARQRARQPRMERWFLDTSNGP